MVTINGTKGSSDKQAVKRQRTKSFFLEATKEIIIQEGIEAVSVRKVAELAGYSFPTLYNNFVDLNELLSETKADLIQDLISSMKSELTDVSNGWKGIGEIFKAYVRYYFRYPNVFRFFYFYRVRPPATKKGQLDYESFDAMVTKPFETLVAEGTICAEEVEAISRLLVYAVHGILTLYFSGNGNVTEKGILLELDQLVDFLGKRGSSNSRGKV